jgi:hypothetical protein
LFLRREGFSQSNGSDGMTKEGWHDKFFLSV